MARPPKRHATNFRYDDDLLAAMTEVAEAEYIEFADVIRGALGTFVAEWRLLRAELGPDPAMSARTLMLSRAREGFRSELVEKLADRAESQRRLESMNPERRRELAAKLIDLALAEVGLRRPD